MSNPFDLLGNDIEDPNATVVPPLKEIVKKTTSSKKTDVPPQSADPSRARKPRAKPAGNEGAFKDRSAGRQKNRSKDAPESSSTKKTNTRKRTDRHSRTGKTDSEKKVNQGWGNNKNELDTEVAAEQDANAEIAADAEEQTNGNKMTLEAYLETQQSGSLNKSVEAKATNKLENAELFVKEEEVYVPATKVKSVKAKQQKAKQFLDFDATFSDALPKGRRGDNRNRNTANATNNNQGRNNRRGGNKGPQNTVEKDRSIDTKNLPSLA